MRPLCGRNRALWAITHGSPERRCPLALTTLQSNNAEIKNLEAQRKLVEKRDGEVPKALAVLQKFARVLSPAQRRQVAKLVGETLDDKPARASKAAAASRKGRKLGKVAPKYRLPTGETWTGRGLTPKAFAAWAKSAEGKAWAQANPGGKFPPASGEMKAPAKAAKKVANGTKKATRKVVKKPAKKLAKKAYKKAVKKAAKKA